MGSHPLQVPVLDSTFVAPDASFTLNEQDQFADFMHVDSPEPREDPMDEDASEIPPSAPLALFSPTEPIDENTSTLFDCELFRRISSY